MIEYLNKAVTYNDLKGLNLRNAENYSNIIMMSFAIGFLISFILLYIAASTLLKNKIITVMFFISALLSLIAGVTVPHYFKESVKINEELDDFNPQYRNVHITSHIDDISNGSEKNTQELRFEHKGENYYAVIPSKTPVTTNDKVTIDIKNQIVDKKLNKHHLSQSINEPKNKVTINHRGKTYNTTLNFTHINPNKSQKLSIFK